MKNLIFVALIVSVMLVLSVGVAFAADGGFEPNGGNDGTGTTTVSAEVGDGSGGSDAPVIYSVLQEKDGWQGR